MSDHHSARAVREHVAAYRARAGATTAAGQRAAMTVCREKAAAYGADLVARGFAAPHAL